MKLVHKINVGHIVLRFWSCKFNMIHFCKGYAVTQLIEALRCSSHGRGFDSRWSHCGFSLI